MQQKERFYSMCLLCKYDITSIEHRNKCTTVNMNTIKYVDLCKESIPKSLMTYGLCGCSAILIIKYQKNTNKSINIAFAHLVFTETIVDFINANLVNTNDYDYYVIVKTPGEYELINGKYKFNTKNKLLWDNILRKRDEYHNVNYEFINYNINTSLSEDMSYRKLYCDIRYDDEKNYCIYYTDNYGIFKPILSIAN